MRLLLFLLSLLLVLWWLWSVVAAVPAVLPLLVVDAAAYANDDFAVFTAAPSMLRLFRWFRSLLISEVDKNQLFKAKSETQTKAYLLTKETELYTVK